MPEKKNTKIDMIQYSWDKNAAAPFSILLPIFSIMSIPLISLSFPGFVAASSIEVTSRALIIAHTMPAKQQDAITMTRNIKLIVNSYPHRVHIYTRRSSFRKPKNK